MNILPTLSSAFLRSEELAGRLPLELGALTLAEAAGIAATLPAAGPADDLGRPRGWGIVPPRGAEPTVVFGRRVVDQFGEPCPKGGAGALGCMWAGQKSSETGLPVFRVWCKSEPGRGTQDAKGHWYRMVDCYADCIGKIRAQGDHVPRLTGWQIVRLDGDGVEQ